MDPKIFAIFQQDLGLTTPNSKLN